jgi:hypothetical protein
VRVAEPNRRWASDITGIRAWDGRKGRVAIMIDCADRMVLAWRFAKRIRAEDLAEMLREAVFRRFGAARSRAQGIEFLSDNGPEYTSHRFRPFVRAMGLIPCHTPRRSPESNGLAEAFFGSFKRDYVYPACLETFETVGGQIPGWIEHSNRHAPHSALGMQAPTAFYADWRVKHTTRLFRKIQLIWCVRCASKGNDQAARSSFVSRSVPAERLSHYLGLVGSVLGPADESSTARVCSARNCLTFSRISG